MKDVKVFLLLLLGSQQVMFAASAEPEEEHPSLRQIFYNEKPLPRKKQLTEQEKEAIKEIEDARTLTLLEKILEKNDYFYPEKNLADDRSENAKRKKDNYDREDLYNDIFLTLQEAETSKTEEEKDYLYVIYSILYFNLDRQLFPSTTTFFCRDIADTFQDEGKRIFFLKQLQAEKTNQEITDLFAEMSVNNSSREPKKKTSNS